MPEDGVNTYFQHSYGIPDTYTVMRHSVFSGFVAIDQLENTFERQTTKALVL